VIDVVRYPALSAYLSRLPDGLDSYPECASKGSMVRSALEGHDVRADASHLPAALAELIEAPPPPTRWIPLVCAEAIFHLVCDRYYPSEEAAIEWSYQRTLAMAASPLYRKLVTVAGPGLLLKIGSRVHGLFERGTSVLADVRGTTARVELLHPPHVHSPLNQVTNVGMLRAIIEITGGKNIRCKMTRSSPRGAVFECSWD
jgi:hypothetical protein